MPRSVSISLPSDQTEQLTHELQQLPGLLGLSVQRGTSLKPPGDILNLTVTTTHIPDLMHLLDRHQLGSSAGSSVTFSEPTGMLNVTSKQAIERDASESSWEEVQTTIGKESNMTISKTLNMFLAGLLAAYGIATGALHIVIGAMVIAPGFEPLTRVPLSLITGSEGWKRGLSDTLKGYGALAVGGALAAATLMLVGTNPVPGKGSYLEQGELYQYWTTISWTSVFISSTAGAAGALLLTINRPVLTAGVMIALALVPTAAMVGSALVDGNLQVAGDALLRWLLDVALVVVFSAVVIAWKQRTLHRRKAAL